LVLDESLPCEVVENYFTCAHEEYNNIKTYCIEDEDSLCGIAFLYIARGLYILNLLRNHRQDALCQYNITEKDVFYWLTKANKYCEKARDISPTGYRSLYLFHCVQSLIEILKNNRDLITDRTKPFYDKHNMCRKTGIYLFTVLGWIDKEYSQSIEDALSCKDTLEQLKKALFEAVSTYDNSVLLRSYRPNIFWAFAVVFWDFSLELNVEMAKNALYWLEKARVDANRLKHDNIGIYSMTRLHVEVQSPETFLRHVEQAVAEIHKRVGAYLDEKNDFSLEKYSEGLKLFCLHIGQKIPKDELRVLIEKREGEE
jgi:hypothetical protein